MSNILKIAGAGVSAAAEETDEYFNQTVLLLHGDGTDGTRNNTFLDSTGNHTVVRNPASGPNAPTQGTFSPFSAPDGRWSVYFDGEADSYLNTPATGQFAPTGDFTIAWWYYPIVFQTSVMLANYTGNNATDWSFETDSDGDLNIYLNGNTPRITGSAVLNLNQWNYIVVSRSGSTVTAYCNGSSVNTYSFGTGTFGSASKSIRIGAGSAGTNNAEGYISNVYLLDGTALGGTVPTTPYSNTSGVELLTCQSNRFVDNSTSPNAITVNSSGVKVTPFSPFAPTAAYDASVNGGSGYFDGTGDYLTAGSASDWAFLHNTGATWTLEFWVYHSASGEDECYVDTSGGTTSNSGVLIFKNASNEIALRIYRGVSSSFVVTGQSTGTLTANSWNHVFISYDQSLASDNVIFYINGVSAGTITKTVNAPSDSDPAYSLRIGTYANGSGDFIKGYISNYKISNVVRSVPSGVPTSPYTSDANTSLLLNFTNAAIFDQTGKNVLETVADAQIDTTTKKFGTGSMEFDGTGDYILMNGGENFAFGTGDFTIEFWLRITTTSGVQIVYDSRPSATNGAQPIIYVNSGVITFQHTSSARITGSSLSIDTWYHVALARSGTDTKMFVDGTQVGSTYSSDTTAYLNGASRPVLGSDGATINSNLLNGFIDDLRITKGVARYTADFSGDLPTKEFPNL